MARQKGAPTWQGLGPLDSRNDLPASQPVQGGHESRGGVGHRAVVAGIDGVWLNGLEKGQHGGDELGHGPGHQGTGLGQGGRAELRRGARLDPLQTVQLLGLTS